jgi:superfamily II DNA or RNA helicase
LTPNLRHWQSSALEALAASETPDFLAESCPGAGKTTFGVAAASQIFRARRASQLLVVVPTAHLTRQWAFAAHHHGFELDWAWSPDTRVRHNYDGVVLTYHQLALHPQAVARFVARLPTVVLLDEIHHAGDEARWGDALAVAVAGAAYRIALSGTPFRSDGRAIPFLAYSPDGQAKPDYRYTYAQAVADRVCRPITFPRVGGTFEWRSSRSDSRKATFDDAVAADELNHRLRTALSPHGHWLPEVLRHAHQDLVRVRQAGSPRAGGLAIASDQQHARDIAFHLRQVTGSMPTVVLSDNPSASRWIERFRKGRDPWIVAVRMVSEGVDIPRLRVGLYAAITSTELFFRQVVGRFARWEADAPPDQAAQLYLPDDPRLRSFAEAIAGEARTGLWDRQEADRCAAARTGRPRLPGAFAALASVASSVRVTTPNFVPNPSDSKPMPGEGLEPRAAAEQSLKLRIDRAVRRIAGLTGARPAATHAKANRAAGIGTSARASVEQLTVKARYLEMELEQLAD